MFRLLKKTEELEHLMNEEVSDINEMLKVVNNIQVIKCEILKGKNISQFLLFSEWKAKLWYELIEKVFMSFKLELSEKVFTISEGSSPILVLTVFELLCHCLINVS